MILTPLEIQRPLDALAIFGRQGPLEIEIGVGKGRFALEYATAFPDCNLLGIEKSAKWLGRADQRIDKAQVQNVRFVRCYSEPFLAQFIENESVQAFHVYFPDPWPKKRHSKRRLFQPEFLISLHRTLVPDGKIYIASDHKEYFASIQETFLTEARTKFKFEIAERGPFSTNFQAKYEKEGRPIYFALATKLPGKASSATK